MTNAELEQRLKELETLVVSQGKIIADLIDEVVGLVKVQPIPPTRHRRMEDLVRDLAVDLSEPLTDED